MFEFEKDSNLRIMSNNVWVNDNNIDSWIEMGEDCSAEHRAKGLAACYMALMPDIINVQKMTVVMYPYVLKNMSDYGHSYAVTENIHSLNILYNTKTVVLSITDTIYLRTAVTETERVTFGLCLSIRLT